MSYWIKNTEGKPSASLTLVMVAFTIVMLWMTLSIFVNPFGIATVQFNASEAMIVLSPLLATYFGRRYTHDVSRKKPATPTPPVNPDLDTPTEQQ